ncbi:MAG: winged-helix domain-containing protein [Dehalococcoidia bacterium]|nr:winged-helix domain-containing protein [Dehalococcoidia bacterium]
MPTVLLVAPAENKQSPVLSWLQEAGVQATLCTEVAQLAGIPVEEAPGLLIVDATSLSAGQVTAALEQAKVWQAPVLGILSNDDVGNSGLLRRLHDFVLERPRSLEFVARVQRLLHPADGEDERHLIQVGVLVIDTKQYEVRVACVRKLLTYKEYELLRLLASNPGRVFTREELLSKVWGYDYFGGTRTVDVHIRRLRSKVEDLEHSFIETIWNVGYRFKAAPT